eukprot:c13159_g1_i1.p1 GENE.c13159_g1_i1~~c13159_g1_i1.p1  ORF type:complete len:215 (+),score=39.99 c13159_g1_i1:389-1033(+)
MATPLYMATINGHFDIVEFLLSVLPRSSIDLPNDLGYSPLFAACQRDHFQIAKLLVLKGANVDRVCGHRRPATPMTVAAPDLKQWIEDFFAKRWIAFVDQMDRGQLSIPADVLLTIYTFLRPASSTSPEAVLASRQVPPPRRKNPTASTNSKRSNRSSLNSMFAPTSPPSPSPTTCPNNNTGGTSPVLLQVLDLLHATFVKPISSVCYDSFLWC